MNQPIKENALKITKPKVDTRNIMLLKSSSFTSGVVNYSQQSTPSTMPALRFNDIPPLEDIIKSDLSLISAKREHIHAKTKDVMKELEEFSTKFLTKT